MEKHEILEITGMKEASDYQVAIFQYIQDQLEILNSGNLPKSLIVEAVAGSGKTTTIVAAVNLALQFSKKPKVLFLAFNKSIATELKSRLPGGVKAETLNAMGNGIWGRYVKGVYGSWPELSKYKTNTIMRKLYNWQKINDYGKHVRFLVGMCKSLGVIPEGISGFASPSNMMCDDKTLMGICRHFHQYVPAEDRPTVFNMVREVLSESLRDEQTIDFDDQKYMTTARSSGSSNLPSEKFDIIIIDEVQDVNSVDMALIEMLSKPNAMIIGVGDRYQSIYGFRGSDTEAIPKFKSKFNADTLPLSITYRCGKKIVEHAQELVPSIQAPNSAHEGEVVYYDTYGPTLFVPGDLIICRNNHPTVELAFKLLANRIPVHVKGRDIGNNLIGIIRTIASHDVWVDNPNKPGKKIKSFQYDNIEISELSNRLLDWKNTNIDIIRKQNQDDVDSIQRIEDIHDSIKVFLTEGNTNTVQDVVDSIVTLFDTTNCHSDEDVAEKFVTLSTVHKSKGLEADRVFILNSDLFFNDRIREDTWEYQQEKNLQYVARTRSINKLCYIELDHFDSDADTEISEDLKGFIPNDIQEELNRFKDEHEEMVRETVFGE